MVLVPVPVVNRTFPVGDERQQTFILLPPDFARQYPTAWQAEMEMERGELKLVVVNNLNRPKAKRYRIVRHHGSYRVSIPRWYLQSKLAKLGDIIEMRETPTALFFSLIKPPKVIPNAHI